MKYPNRKIMYDYLNNRANAKRRNIDFNLTFDEWWNLWKKKYHLRGRKKGEYHLCRKNDVGAYEIGNVYVAPREQNRREQKSTINKKVTITNSLVLKEFNSVVEASQWLGIQPANFRKYMRKKTYPWFTI